MVTIMKVYAFNDLVGVVCSDDCGADVMRDINGDNDNADAGCENLNGPIPSGVWPGCMGCGKDLS